MLLYNPETVSGTVAYGGASNEVSKLIVGMETGSLDVRAGLALAWAGMGWDGTPARGEEEEGVGRVSPGAGGGGPRRLTRPGRGA